MRRRTPPARSGILLAALPSFRTLTLGCAFALTACDRKAAPVPGSGVPDSKPDQPAPVSAVVPAPVYAAPPTTGKAPVLSDPDQRASYSLGYRIGASMLRDQDFHVDQTALFDGLRDSLAKRKGLIDEEEMRLAGEAIKARATARADTINEGKLAEANEFLANNARRPGIQSTTSGLQYEIIKPAADPNAPKPNVKDTVDVHYQGTLADGTVFDSSIKRGEPITVAIAGVMSGWVEALPLMAVGEKRRVYLPPTLGYGAKGAGSVPPNSVLIFDLELLAIKTIPEPAK